MKIGLLTDYHIESRGGVQTSVRNLALGLLEQNHQVTVVMPVNKDFDDIDLSKEPFDIVQLEAQQRIKLDQHYPMTPTDEHVELLEKLNFDILHCHTMIGMASVAKMLHDKTGVPYIQTLHEIWPEQTEHHSPLPMLNTLYLSTIGAWQLKRKELSKLDWTKPKQYFWGYIIETARHANAVTAPSNHFAESVSKRSEDLSVSVIPNSVEQLPVRRPGKPKKPFNILWAGRLDGEKRPSVAIKVIEILSQNHDVHLHIAGQGSLDRKIARKISNLKLDDKVTMHGWLDREPYTKLLAKSDAFLLTSSGFDNQPMVILEAQTAGVPVVYCDEALTDEIVNEGAILSSDDTPKEIARSLDKLIKDQDLYEKLASEALMARKRFSVESVSKQFIKLYKTVLSSK